MAIAQSKPQTLVYDCSFSAASSDLISPRLLVALRGGKAYVIDGVLMSRGQSPGPAAIRANSENGLSVFWVARAITSNSDRPIKHEIDGFKVSFNLKIDKANGQATLGADMVPHGRTRTRARGTCELAGA